MSILSHFQIPDFDIFPRFIRFPCSKLLLNHPYSLTFTISNCSNTTQTITLEPVPNIRGTSFTLHLSDTSLTLKKGKSAAIEVTLTFTQRSTSLSKLIIISSKTTRDFVSISASSEQKIFGMHPELLPLMMDHGGDIQSVCEDEKSMFRVPAVLVALKRKLLALDGLCSVGMINDDQ